MRSFIRKQSITKLLIVLNIACQTTNQEQQRAAPSINEDTSTEEAVQFAIQFGGQTLYATKQLLDQRKAWPKAQQLTYDFLINNMEKAKHSELINAVNLYQSSVKEPSLTLIEKLLLSRRKEAQILGWIMARNFPSPQVAQLIDSVLTKYVVNSTEDDRFVPQMAEAIQANHLRSSYALMRQALMSKGDPAFAQAMVFLDPKQAANDFLDYLSLATPEELRQINQTNVNIYTAMYILRFYMSHEVPLSHPKFSYLIYYAISRNKSLADLAMMVMAKVITQSPQNLALALARMPDWVQMAYIESARQNLSPEIRNFLGQFKEYTAHKSVIDELDSIR